MLRIKYKQLTVLEIENGMIIKILLPENNRRIIKKINNALENNEIHARVKKSKSHDVYHLYYGSRTFPLTPGEVIKINRPAQGELW